MPEQIACYSFEDNTLYPGNILRPRDKLTIALYRMTFTLSFTF